MTKEGRRKKEEEKRRRVRSEDVELRLFLVLGRCILSGRGLKAK
jgi:hypothetical protein